MGVPTSKVIRRIKMSHLSGASSTVCHSIKYAIKPSNDVSGLALSPSYDRWAPEGLKSGSRILNDLQNKLCPPSICGVRGAEKDRENDLLTLPVSRLGSFFIHYSSHLYTAIPPQICYLKKRSHFTVLSK